MKNKLLKICQIQKKMQKYMSKTEVDAKIQENMQKIQKLMQMK